MQRSRNFYGLTTFMQHRHLKKFWGRVVCGAGSLVSLVLSLKICMYVDPLILLGISAQYWVLDCAFVKTTNVRFVFAPVVSGRHYTGRLSQLKLSMKVEHDVTVTWWGNELQANAGLKQDRQHLMPYRNVQCVFLTCSSAIFCCNFFCTILDIFTRRC